MTENKRFTITDDFQEHHVQIRENGRIIMGCFLKPQAEPIVNRLNGLNDENMYLKSTNMEYEDALGRLEEENKKLIEKLEKGKCHLCGASLKYCGVDL